MAFTRRSRLGSQLRGISKQLGVSGRLAQGGVDSLVDTSVREIQRTDQNIKYFPVTGSSPYLVPLQELIAGSNIVGVRTVGAFTVQIPLRATEEQVIIVTDERGRADIEPITIEVA